jgi:hypothetical protein
MNPAVFVVLGVGAFIVWYSTRPGAGGIGELFGITPGEPGAGSVAPPFTQEQLNYYLSGFATHLTSAQAASVGASAGGPLAGATFGISLGIGALVGFLSVRNSNDAKEDREVFAERLGFKQLGAENDPRRVTVTSIDGRESLYGYLNFVSEQTGNPRGWDLVHVGLNVIGRKDFDGNVQWMVDVLTLLYSFGFKFPR